MGQKKIMQPLGDKKNYTTSLDKKKSCYLSGQQQKIMQPIETKKIMQPHRTKKHVTSKDKKIMKKNLYIMNSIGWPLNQGSPGSCLHR